MVLQVPIKSLINVLLIIISLHVSFESRWGTPISSKIIFVYEHARHGARSPSTNYNTEMKDGYDEFRVYWGNEGNGELTKIGIRQHYALGVRNRYKYSSLIDFSNYNLKEILVHVTDYNRTHQSVNSELLAMYQPGILKDLEENDILKSYPSNKDIWINNTEDIVFSQTLTELSSLNKHVTINNIPVFNLHNFPENRVFVLTNLCKNMDSLREVSIKKNKKILFGPFEPYFDKLRNFLNYTDDQNFYNITVMNSITDRFIADYIAGKDLSVFQEKTKINLDSFYKLCTEFYVNSTFLYFLEEHTSHLESCTLMNDLLGYMSRRLENLDKTTYAAPKMVLDIGHDYTVAPMEKFMDYAFNNTIYNHKMKYCGFACNIYFEMYENIYDNGITNYTVKYFIDDELIDEFSYDDFVSYVSKGISLFSKIDDFCLLDESDGNTKNQSNKEAILLALSIIFGITTILGIGGIVFLYFKFNKSNTGSYMPNRKGSNESNEESINSSNANVMELVDNKKEGNHENIGAGKENSTNAP